MPKRAKQACEGPDCFNVAEKGRFCDACFPRYGQKKDRSGKRNQKRRADNKAFYNSQLWEALRDEQLRNYPWCQCDHPSCDHRNPTCGSIATVCDHITPRIPDGPPEQDESGNLQSMCVDCHNRKTRREDGWAGNTRTQVTVVCGPPGAGKTTYVLKHMRQGDLIVDLDRILDAITVYPTQNKPDYLLKLAWDCRDALIQRVQNQLSGLRRAWIIDCAASKHRRDALRRRLDARIIVLEVDVSTCMHRIESDERRDKRFDWNALVTEWWDDYERSDEDTIAC